MKKQRNPYMPEEKVAMQRRPLLTRSLSRSSTGHGLLPLRKKLFENGASAFEQKRPTDHSAEPERIYYLEKKIQIKDEVPAELMAEHVALKKRIGNSNESGSLPTRGT